MVETDPWSSDDSANESISFRMRPNKETRYWRSSKAGTFASQVSLEQQGLPSDNRGPEPVSCQEGCASPLPHRSAVSPILARARSIPHRMRQGRIGRVAPIAIARHYALGIATCVQDVHAPDGVS